MIKNPKTELELALQEYSKGDLQGSLRTLAKLTTYAEYQSAQAYNKRQAIAPNPLVAWTYIDLAIDRLKKESGEDIIAVMPFKMCINTALQYC